MSPIQRRGLPPVPFNTLSVALISTLFLIVVVLSYKLLIKADCSNNYVNAATAHYNKLEQVKPRTKPLHSKHRLAVLVPFRDRFEELMEFAPFMNKFLTTQQIDFHIYILNQVDTYRFNRASLINVGFIVVRDEFDYIAMHDVDLLPLNKNLKYSYPIGPIHLAAPNLHPRYHYEKFIGGILLINREHFELVKGLSNRYWGWGLEDDEFFVRLRDANLNVTRPVNISTNTTNTFSHLHSRARKRDTTKCYNQREVTRKRDRVTGLHNVKYKVINFKELTIEGAPVTVINIQLFCDKNETPWCDCSDITR